tara:strand:- start:197 stop:652 length:456 start_codon:yes stop_codon:yes gene_type:complete
MGNPTQGGIKNVAIANGSECGDPLGFANNSTMLYLNDRTDLSYLEGLGVGFIQLLGWNPLKFVSSVFSTDTDIIGRFTVKALPNQEVKQIYDGDVFISKTVLWTITIHESIIDELDFNSQSTMLPLDNSSGGIYDVESFTTLPPNIRNSFF